MITGSSCTPSSCRTAPQVVVVGPPGTRRMELLLAAARRAGWHRPTALPYPRVQLLPHPCLEGTPRRGPPPPHVLVRLDSPQDDLHTLRCLLTLGIAPTAAAGRTPLSPQQIERLSPARGELVHPLQWFLGFRELLQGLSQRWTRNVSWMSHPQAVLQMFDKHACRQLWSAAGLPVAPSPACPQGYDELRQQVRSPHARLFIKLRYGYAAAGATALEWHGSRLRAISTVETVRHAGQTRLFVSRRPQILLDERQIAQLIDLLAQHQIIVEEWLPKARWQGVPFDVRLVLVRGRVRHVVGRARASPFTNLNLGARRIPRDTLMQHLRAWDDLVSLAEQAAACFPTAGTLGLDVLVLPCRRRMVLLEANAFGDYLPGLLHAGATTYEAAFQEYLAS
jgi:glutathione synthase/RimK-type ligase-like ATP-grasp enzyme